MHKIVGGSWYLVNGGWVKNVNKLRRNTGIVCGVLSTKTMLSFRIGRSINGKLFVVHMFNRFLLTTVSTPKNISLHLSKWIYTHYPHPLLIERLMKN